MNYPRDPALAARIEAVYQDANRKAEARAARIADIERIVTAWADEYGVATQWWNHLGEFGRGDSLTAAREWATRYAEAEGATD